MSDGLVLYHIPQSRSLTALWMLEEIGEPYRIVQLDIDAGEQRDAAYRRINPSGKVPTVIDDGVTITERGAICVHLADRYAPGRLAPAIGDPRRADYLRWMFYGAGVVEPLLALAMLRIDIDAPPGALAWGEMDTMREVLRETLADREWFLGDDFTAADVMTGSMLVWGLGVDALPKDRVFQAYADRCGRRPSFQRTAEKDGMR